MTSDEAQGLIDDSSKFKELKDSTRDFINREDYSEIIKDTFIKVMEKLLSELGFKPTWSDYSSLWGTYETELGTNEENMNDPQIFLKYSKDLVQEFIWLHS
ncbi:unnamed protein product [Moneuplotes crassus]|uniref:Uncharacterized protein n=1 Tax=Euplotes crassus TaxID=5936 RepID=A0AAD1Y335_EUPCR|nr:unnamed protein product [Moneuplotes crassus]